MPSRDDLIAQKAKEFADQIKQVAAMADKEEEIRIAAERQLAFIEKEAGVKLEGKHEFTVASGRVDSVYDRVIIEYKNPSSPGARIGPKANSPGCKKVVEQIKKRFYDMRSQKGQPLNTLFGVGLDGNHFVFVRFRDDKWYVQDPVEVNRYSAERFLWALLNLGRKGKPFSPDYLAGDFGADAKLAREGIHALYDAIATATHPRAQTFFNQWKILFGEVCGYDVDNPSDKIMKLAEFYGVAARNPKSAELLFAVHTYYAIFMKLLAAEIVAFFHNLPTPLKKMQTATTSAKLKREMEDLEAGSIFRHLNITNFLEGDLFAWYTTVWSEPIQKLVRDMVARLDNYNPGTLSEDPAGSRDLLKKLYQQLFPKSVRHDLGEYYTPDWLAEHVLNEVGYIGDPDKRLLDPACGSGTFLVMAINRIRKWYDDNREKCRFGEDDLCRKILANVVGFDLNPLAVMAARTNYLIAIRDLIGRVDKIEIPVYLCDSILTPSTYGDLFVGTTEGVKELKTAAAKFLIPTEITTCRDDVAKYAEQLEACIKNGYSPKEFIERCQEEGLTVTSQNLHADLYMELVKLDKANKNGVWARIIKNAFAPLFVGKVDYVAGNPPWVRWSYLPDEYCQASWPLWEKYGLFQAKGHKAKVNAGELDVSMLFVFSCLDNYVCQGGGLGFVITGEVWQSKVAGLGFRRFRIGEGVPFRVTGVSDFVAVKPFKGAANKTTSFAAIKGQKHEYPVKYIRYSPPNDGDEPNEYDSWEKWKSWLIDEALWASPISGDKGAWQLSRGKAARDSALASPSYYKARLGARLDPYGVFLLHPLQIVGKYILVRNAPELGKKDIETTEVKLEQDLLYPALRGSDVQRWGARPELLTIITNLRIGTNAFVSYELMKQKSPHIYAYFKKFWDVLKEKEDYWTYFGQVVDSASAEVLDRRYLHWRRISKPMAGGVRQVIQASNVPLYSASKIGPYTFQPYRVVWPRMASDICAAVIGQGSINVAGKSTENKTVVPNDTVTLVGFDDEDEAHYFCGCMNSVVVRVHVRSFSSPGRGFAPPSILEHTAIPRFDAGNKIMRQLADISRRCHEMAARGWRDGLIDAEASFDEAAAALWKVSAHDLGQMRSALVGH